MSLSSLPQNPPELTPLRRISPSRYHAINQCVLREVWHANRVAPILPVSPTIRLGLVAHRVLELGARSCLDNQEVIQVWNEATSHVEEQMRQAGEERFVPLSQSAQKFEVKKRLTFAAVQMMTTKQPPRTGSGGPGPGTAQVEAWLESEDGLLGGYVDRIVPGKSGVELLDYKSGAITERGTGVLKAAYESQLLLYAAIYWENRGAWPVRLTLASLAGTKHDVPLDTARACYLMDEARAKLRSINRLILSGVRPEGLANPSPAACTYCGYRPVCREYWKQREHNAEWPADVSGVVNSVKMLGNGTLFVALDTSAGLVTVRGLSPRRFSFLMQDVRTAMLCDLGRDVGSSTYRQVNLTTGYALAQ